jgi:DNA-binding NarL/FixJ family response regulator
VRPGLEASSIRGMKNASKRPRAAAEIRVVLVDDHGLFRSGLHEVLAKHGVDVVGEASNGETAVEVVRDVAPDVVVMDLAMPGMSGIQAAMKIRAAAPSAKVVMLTVSADERDIDEAIVAGACGYLLKDAAAEEIVAGVRAAAAGEALLSPRIAASLLERTRADAASLPDQARAELTKREGEVLNLMAEGKENTEIAEDLFISPHTVKNHVSNILGKLESQSRVEAAVKAARGHLL